MYCSDPKDVEFIYHNDGKYPARMHIEAWREYRREKGLPMGVLIELSKGACILVRVY